MGGPGQEESLRKKARTGQIACAITIMISAAFGIACIIYTAQANVCNSPGPGFEPKMGTYSSVFLDDNPTNCIVDCQRDCLRLYVEETHLKTNCQACFNTCTYPWDDNIETCEQQESCTSAFEDIESFCRPLSICYRECASGCIGDCENAGYTAAWTGCVSMIFFLLAFFLPLAIGTMSSMVTPLFAGIGLLCWIAALALGSDALNLNINGRGWNIKETGDSLPGNGGKITPNWLPGVVLIIGLMANVMMILAYYDWKEIWNKRPPPAPVTTPPEPVEAPIEPLPYYVPGKDDGEIDTPALEASLVQQSLRSSSPVPGRSPPPTFMSAQSAAPQMQSPGLTSMSQAPLTSTSNTTIGLNFMHNKQGEAVVESVVPRGPADISVEGVGRILPGDVVIQIGLFPQFGGEPNMVDVSRTPIKEWFGMLRNRPAGSRVRFILARHEIQGKYHVDLTFRPKMGMP